MLSEALYDTLRGNYRIKKWIINGLLGCSGGGVVSFPFGCYAVLTFFVMSGYFAVSGFEKLDAKEYGVKRFLRLYPAYWASLMIVYPLTILYLPSRSVGFKEFLLNFTMLQTLFGARDVDGAYWTLLCELIFYIIVFLICFTNNKRKFQYFILAYAFGLVCLNLFSLFRMFETICKVNDMMYLYCFMIGAVISLIKQCCITNKTQKALLIVALVVFIAQQFISHDFKSGIYLIFSTAILVGAIYLWEMYPIEKNSFWAKSVSFIASISYPIYLLHQNIGYMILQYFENLGYNNEFIILLPIFITLILASIIYYTVEVPIGKITFKICDAINR